MQGEAGSPDDWGTPDVQQGGGSSGRLKFGPGARQPHPEVQLLQCIAVHCTQAASEVLKGVLVMEFATNRVSDKAGNIFFLSHRRICY